MEANAGGCPGRDSFFVSRLTEVVHHERVVHSDLKARQMKKRSGWALCLAQPGNFLMVKRRLKLIDFGIAKRTDSLRQSQACHFMSFHVISFLQCLLVLRIASNTTNISRESSVGTISYMAPEASPRCFIFHS